jgi:hypothetical protein
VQITLIKVSSKIILIDVTLSLTVRNLPMDVRVRHVEDLFCKFGRIRDIDLFSGHMNKLAFGRSCLPPLQLGFEQS